MELKRKVLTLEGYKSYMALIAYQRLVIGLQMIPGNMHMNYDELCAVIEAMTEEDQLKTLRQAALVVDLKSEEVDALICFCTDKNGIPYTAENKKSLKPEEYVEIIVTVCFEILRNVKIDLLTDNEKKNSSPSQLMSAEPS